MIRKITLLTALIFTISIVSGQNVFLKGKNAFTIGGGYRTIGTEVPSVNASFEHSFKTFRDIGHLAAGLYADVLMKEDTISPVGTLRGSFHLGFFRTKIMDPYFGVGLAVAPVEKTLFHPDAYVGCRFKLNRKKRFGLFTEVGYYGANLRLGACWIW